MELSVVTKPARQESANSYGSQDVSMVAGEILRIETSPGGAEILDVTVPSGKAWEVSVTISIREIEV